MKVKIITMEVKSIAMEVKRLAMEVQSIAMEVLGPILILQVRSGNLVYMYHPELMV